MLSSMTDKQRTAIMYAIFVVIALAVIALIISVTHNTTQEVNATSIQTIGQAAITYEDSTYKNTVDLYEIQTLINITEEKRDAAYMMEQAARVLGYTDIIEQAMTDYQYNLDANEYYIKRYQYVIDTYYKENMEKYPIASEIWIRLKAYGYSDYVCAGILGNVMAEVGGQTLNIKEETWSTNPNYYGICQWNTKYYSDVNGLDLDGQIDYLLSNIEQIFNTYGNYEEFINSTDEKQIALMFAQCYERCGSASYDVRQTNATKALDVFCLKNEK